PRDSPTRHVFLPRTASLPSAGAGAGAFDEDRGDFEETIILVHKGHPEVDPGTWPRARIREDGRGAPRRRWHGRRGVQRQVVAFLRRPHSADRPLDDGFREDAVASARADGNPYDAGE